MQSEKKKKIIWPQVNLCLPVLRAPPGGRLAECRHDFKYGGFSAFTRSFTEIYFWKQLQIVDYFHCEPVFNVLDRAASLTFMRN